MKTLELSRRDSIDTVDTITSGEDDFPDAKNLKVEKKGIPCEPVEEEEEEGDRVSWAVIKARVQQSVSIALFVGLIVILGSTYKWPVSLMVLVSVLGIFEIMRQTSTLEQVSVSFKVHVGANEDSTQSNRTEDMDHDRSGRHSTRPSLETNMHNRV